MASRIALITGANRGLGFEIARQLGKRGHQIALGARDPALGEDAAAELRDADIEATAVPVDVTRPHAIDALEPRLRERFGRLDVLVNNAGINVDDWVGPSGLATDTLRTTLETNVLGAHQLSRSMLSLLRASPAGRIVNVSSTLGSLNDIGNPDSPYAAVTQPAYQLSKAALNALTVLYAKELKDTSIKVNAACPGWVRTRIGGGRAPDSVVAGADTPVWLATLPQDGPTGGFFNARRPIAW